MFMGRVVSVEEDAMGGAVGWWQISNGRRRRVAGNRNRRKKKENRNFRGWEVKGERLLIP